uniref:Protein FAR1-RELATED SEQUENCE n=1 Tax=Cannabis sativa TaxID=3483 RepID=A0A803PS07_CANSA
MDSDNDNFGTLHLENMDIQLKTSNDLDLNVEQDNRSQKVAHASCSTHSTFSSKDEVGVDSILQIGTEFDSDEHAYKFYNKYARLVGFSVRKDWVNRSKVHGQVVSRKFTCSKEGYRRKDRRDVNVRKHRKETRTGCLAHMIITRQPDGKYRVTHFEAQHNHDNVSPCNVQTFPLQRELSVDQYTAADLIEDFRPQSKEASVSMSRQFRVRDSLDDFSFNFDNYLRTERTRDMKEGDAARLMHYFQRQHFENPSFLYALQLDIDDKLSNIFWADDNMVSDYDHFGDVVCFDTVCRTKADHFPFVQFIGVNHHKQVIMSGKTPKTIHTDQDAAIIEAIQSVLPETNHCVCVWQMYENAVKNLSRAVKDAQSFANDLKSCIYDSKDEEDFVHTWETMLEKYSLQQNEWLKWMFREQEKWAVHFERVVDEQRYKETEASDEMDRCMPKLMGNVVILKHASDVYTPRAFEVFQQGYEKCLNVVVNQWSENGPSFEYKTKKFGKVENTTLRLTLRMIMVICNCRKFECVGFLCSHALKVLDHRNIKVVPSTYILKRWTKDARHLDEVIEGVEKILRLKPEEAQGVTSSCMGANASENEQSQVFIDGNAIDDKDNNKANHGERAVLDRDQLTILNEKSSATEGISNVEVLPQSTISCISNSLAVYVSPSATTGNHIMQDSPSQSQLLQEPLIHNTYPESVSNTTQLRQEMDLDIQHSHSASFLQFDQRYRAPDTPYLGHSHK